MRLRYVLPILLALLIVLIPLIQTGVSGQAGVQPRITQPIDNTRLTTMRGNVHPMARDEFDRGAAPASLPMDHMLLVLRRSPQQEAALETLLAEQQDRASPNYHQWLAPEQFGQQFGPSDQDIQKITAWLESQGFRVNEVSKGRTTIDFSGTAGQVQQTFHTAIHSYVFASGEQRWSNATDPQIPTAITPVVAGVHSLNNFPRKRMSHSLGLFRRSKADGKVTALSPNFTFAGNCNGTNTNCYAVGPADFAKIYNVPSSVTGAGQTIAIVSDSDINVGDVNGFRSLFGLPAIVFHEIQTNASTDPGVQPMGNEGEAVLDVEWSGAVAPGAAIDLVVSQSTTAAFGGDISAQYIINNKLAPILSYSYGACELALGTAGNLFYQQLWSQAAGEGITVVVSTGDNGSAGCESPDPTNLSTAQPATTGLAVSGVASTPFNIAVGGTDFNDNSNPTTYWSPTNSASQASAISYIPEVAYNDSCTNPIFASFSGFTPIPETNCNSATLIDFSGINFIASFGGGGGASNCTTNSTTTSTLVVSSCSGGYAKPSWQTGPGVPNDGKRDLPDVSLFSGDGTIQNFYIACQSDQDTGNVACDLNSPFQNFVGVGGTSVAAQAFSGVMALIDQKMGSSQGNANPTFYGLAAAQVASNCNSTGSAAPASTCTFYDVTSGTIEMPCAKGSPNCTVNFSSDSIGILSGYKAGAGYDLATGLGSVNVGSLVSNFGPNFYLSSSSPAVAISSAGASGTMSVTAYPVNGYIGTVNLACTGLPTGATCGFNPNSVAFASSTSATTGIPITVTVNTTTASMMTSPSRPWGVGPSAKSSLVALAFGLLLAGFLVNTRSRERRWSPVLALAAFAVLTGIAACGGGSSKSSGTGSGSTDVTAATLTGTASSGSPISSMTFTVTINK